MAYTTYPFSAILGQEKLKKALIFNLINPKIGGVLITGQKGTAKSTAVRALAELTHKKVITLPLSVTEDRLIGSVDLEQTMKTGKAVYLPGILFEADGQILYVDEVNLLQDHLTDIVLTAHGSKENRVEREGISAVSDCHFLLVGTMNPEEGQLRQHFLDQFGLPRLSTVIRFLVLPALVLAGFILKEKKIGTIFLKPLFLLKMIIMLPKLLK